MQQNWRQRRRSSLGAGLPVNLGIDGASCIAEAGVRMYQTHPSAQLCELFKAKPWQGANPWQAEFLFVGLDANYAADVEAQPIFDALLRYHEDGPAFWRVHGVHHPFLLPAYRGDGRRYHRTFAKIGFTAQHAERVSFIELMHLPTVGRNVLHGSDLDAVHLQRLREMILHGQARHVFLPAGVQRLLMATGKFPELRPSTMTSGTLPVLHDDGQHRVYRHLHFSNYGKFEAQLRAEVEAIRGLIG